MAFATGVARRGWLALLAAALLPLVGCAALDSGRVRVWAASESADVRLDTRAVQESRVYSVSRNAITLEAGLNETLGLQVVLQSDTPPAGPFDVTIGDLRGDVGVLRADERIRRFVAQPIRVETFPSWFPDEHGVPLEPVSVPDVLVPWEAPSGGGPLRLTSRDNAIVWFDLTIPPTAEPGAYVGELRIRHGEDIVRRVEVRLRVRPVALPTTPTLPIVCRVAPHDLLRTHLNWDIPDGPELPLYADEPSHRAALELVDATMQTLHAHRLNPVLWAGFPRHALRGPQEIDVAWDAYDQLVSGWIDGSAYADRVPAAIWPLPVTITHPSAARNGGVRSATYARLLRNYVAACADHFAARGWADAAVLRLHPPATLDEMYVRTLEQLLGTVRQAGISVPFVAHAPVRSLRGLGWFAAPAQALTGVGVWSPPANWLEPIAAKTEQELGRPVWLLPDRPPYSGSLRVGAQAAGVRSLSWQAFRYDAAALWIEHATDLAGDTRPLAYAGKTWGLDDQPVASIRLKRLRRAAYDHDLLVLLERAGKPLLAQRLAEQLVPYAFTDACREHLLSTLPTAWPADADAYDLARTLTLQELSNEFVPSATGTERQLRNETQWELMLGQVRSVRLTPLGVRLEDAETHLTAQVMASVLNTTPHTLSGTWALPQLPAGWDAAPPPPLDVPPNARRPVTIDVDVRNLSYNRDGVYPVEMRLDATGHGVLPTRARLAVAVAPHVDAPPTIDGVLDDWPLGVNNAAGAFRLVRGRQRIGVGDDALRPTLPTRAYFCTDQDHLYVAVRCAIPTGEQPSWQTDNRVPIDGSIPWGQDVVEVLLNPSNESSGLPSETYLLQIKPTGLLVAYHGCPSEPPIGQSQLWNSHARVAVQREREAWTVELAVPLDTLGRAARQRRLWGVNVTRLDARRGEYSSWSAARGQCYTPQSLGNLMLLRP